MSTEEAVCMGGPHLKVAAKVITVGGKRVYMVAKDLKMVRNYNKREKALHI